MTMALKPLPEFASEAEEAQWYADHQDKLLDYFGPAPADPRPLHARLKLPPRGHTEQIALRLPVSDLAAAKAMAEKRGIGYQTLLKAFIHEAIEREQRRA
jgi:hypothetical protein